MSTSSPLRRSMYGLGAAIVLTVTLTGPASARPIPGDTPMTGGVVTTRVVGEPAAQPHNPRPPSYNSTWLGWSPPSAAGGRAEAAASATDTLEYLQIGLAALSGAVLSAAALTVATRTRTHRGRLTHA